MEKGRGNNATRIAILAGLIVARILVLAAMFLLIFTQQRRNA